MQPVDTLKSPKWQHQTRISRLCIPAGTGITQYLTTKYSHCYLHKFLSWIRINYHWFQLHQDTFIWHQLNNWMWPWGSHNFDEWTLKIFCHRVRGSVTAVETHVIACSWLYNSYNFWHWCSCKNWEIDTYQFVCLLFWHLSPHTLYYKV